MSLTEDQVDRVGREMSANTEYVTILTRAQFDELVCRPQADHQMLPQEHPLGAQQATLPTWPGLRDAAYENVIHPYLGNPASVPLGMGAKDLYFDVWRRGRQMNGVFRTRFYEKTYNGTKYIILKGRQNQRSILRGTRYRADNATILDIGIGSKALAKNMVAGLKVGIGVGVAMEVVEWIFNDEYTASDLLGGIGTELVKAGVGTAIGGLGAIAAGMMLGSLVFAPIAGFIIVGALAGYALNEIDLNFDIKKKVQAATAAGLDWLELHSGEIGQWTEARYDDLRTYVNSSVEEFKQLLDRQIDIADKRFETIVESNSEHPYAINPYETRAAALQSTMLRFTRWLIGE